MRVLGGDGARGISGRERLAEGAARGENLDGRSEHGAHWTNELREKLERARDLMRQVGIAGEIQWPAQQPGRGSFAFQVSRPGLILEVKADLERGVVTVQRSQLNGWGVMHLLHTFTGAGAADARNTRDWTLTTVWALSMDAVALGLIVMVFSSYIMWYQLRTKRLAGIFALLLGFIGCGAFIGALRWIL